jgi:toxin FitB
MKYLLDTNVPRELGKTSPHKNVAAWLKSVDDADLAISALAVREIAKGVAKLRKTKLETAALDATVSAIFDAFEGRILPIDCKRCSVALA